MYQIIVVENTLSWEWPRSGSGPDGNQTGPSIYSTTYYLGWVDDLVHPKIQSVLCFHSSAISYS